MTEPVNINKDTLKQTDQGDTPELPAPEVEGAGGLVNNISFDEVRRSYVQKGYLDFDEAFKKYDDGEFPLLFAVAPFFLGILWFLYRKMYLEAVIIFGVAAILETLLNIFGFHGAGLAMMVGMAILLGLAGKWLYWSDVNRKIA